MKVAFHENFRFVCFYVTEIQDLLLPDAPLIYFCNYEAHRPQIFRKSYFLMLISYHKKDIFWKKYSEPVI